MILLDTNVVSETMRSAPDPNVVAWLDAQAPETLFLSVVTVGELRYGVASLPAGRRRNRLRTMLDEHVFPLFAGRILPFTRAEADIWGDWMAKARRQGTALGPLDGQIAVTASAHGLVVATRDRTPFEALGLRVIDPWTSGRHA